MLPIVRIREINRRHRRQLQELQSRRRILRRTQNPFVTFPDRHFIDLYRVTKELAREIITILTPHLDTPSTVRGITNEKKVLVALRFYGTGSYQRGVGEEINCGLSQSAVHNSIHEVTAAIVNVIVPQQIVFPNNIHQRNELKRIFMEKFGFPGTFGAIDGTHIAILKPTLDEHNYINRKGYHSINCQLICDANLRIMNVFANYGGSTHDSFIWNNSQIKNYVNANNERGEAGWFVGDSGYPQTRVMMTPFLNVQEGTPQSRYNKAQMRARNVIERCNGVLKMRFRCLLKERSSRYNPIFMCDIIKVCVALHNMCIDRNVPVPEVHLDGIIDNVEDFVYPGNYNARLDGVNARDTVVRRYFT